MSSLAESQRRYWIVLIARPGDRGHAVFRQALARAAGSLLVVDQPVTPADLIVIPEWTRTAGALEAADLVARRIAPREPCWWTNLTAPKWN